MLVKVGEQFINVCTNVYVAAPSPGNDRYSLYNILNHILGADNAHSSLEVSCT